MDYIGESLHETIFNENVDMLIANRIQLTTLVDRLVPVDIDVILMNNLNSAKEGITRAYKGFDGYDKTAEVARSYMNRGDTIYFVGERTNYTMFTYALCPMKVDHFDLKDLSNWKEELKEYQYVFLLEADDDFKREYGEIFEEPKEILDASFYQVDINDDDIILKYIGTTEAIQYRQE